MKFKILTRWLLVVLLPIYVASCEATEPSPEISKVEITQEVVATTERILTTQLAPPTVPPSPSQTPVAPTQTLEPIPPTETTSPYSDEELAARGRHGYRPPEFSADHPCWIVRFQSSPVLQFDFQGPNQLVFDPSYTFFVSDARVPVMVQMSRSEQNVWSGSFSTVIDVYNFSVSEDIVFEEDGIIWHEIFRDSRPGYYSNTVECGPARWTRVP